MSAMGTSTDDETRRIEAVAHVIVGACLRVHRELGPGLLEATYQACLAHELRACGCSVEMEVELPVRYRDILVKPGYRIDMVVEDRIIVENKSIQALLPVHKSQILTYLKLSGLRIGFLINWNLPKIRDGIQRYANNH